MPGASSRRAIRLRVSTATISGSVKNLENHLSVRLLDRNTHHGTIDPDLVAETVRPVNAPVMPTTRRPRRGIAQAAGRGPLSPSSPALSSGGNASASSTSDVARAKS
jgi:hypothetical protein